MEIYDSSKQYMFNLHVSSSSEAKRLWKKTIKDKWDNKCAYCGSEENLTIDHILPRSRGGLDEKTNVLCCCRECNHSKGLSDWETWYNSQYFFDHERYEKIKEWKNPSTKKNMMSGFYSYGSRRNNAT